MATDMLSFYHGDEPGGTPGLLPDPYYCMCTASLVLDAAVPLLLTAHRVGGWFNDGIAHWYVASQIYCATTVLTPV